MSLAIDLLIANEKVPHRAHQLVGVEALLAHPFFLLADEVGAGKSKQVVDTAQILFLQKQIDTVVVFTPGFARSTWADQDPILGEVAKHAWDSVPNVIHEYHKRFPVIAFHASALNWVVSNYEFIRREERLVALMAQLRGRRTFLVLDESWAVKGFSAQMKACRALRYKRAERVVELNGTPLADGKPTDLYYPMMILDPDILGVKNRTHFHSKYCVMGGYMNKQVIRYQNLDDLNAKIAPYVLSRRTRDCFDLPPMLEPITIEARLSDSTWALYKDQRDNMVSWLGSQVSVSSQAIVKALRLAQIASGYLGGLEEFTGELPAIAPAISPFGAPPPWLRKLHEDSTICEEAQAASITSSAGPAECDLGAEPEDQDESGRVGGTPVQVGLAGASHGPITRELSREKLDATLEWLDSREPPPHKLLVWCRFRAELERATVAFGKVYPHVFQLRGGQTKPERLAAKMFLAPGSDPRSGAVVGNQKAGGASLNFAAANIAIYMSNGPALIERTQSIGRIERPGATQPMLIVDVLATGPKGQKTIDHIILKALRTKDDMAQWTVNQWRQILKSA